MLDMAKEIHGKVRKGSKRVKQEAEEIHDKVRDSSKKVREESLKVGYRFREEGLKIKQEIVEKMATLATAAFGLVAALAWNDAIKSLFAEGGVLHGVSTGGVWVYAGVVTLIAVFATVWIGRVAGKIK